MNLKDQRSAALKGAQAILKTAQSTGRDLTDSEDQTIQGLFAQIEDLDAKIAKGQASAELMQKLAGLGGPGYSTTMSTSRLECSPMTRRLACCMPSGLSLDPPTVSGNGP